MSAVVYIDPKRCDRDLFYFRVLPAKEGVTDGARTRDLRSHNPMLYQLSYGHHAHPDSTSEKAPGKTVRISGFASKKDHALPRRRGSALRNRRSRVSRSRSSQERDVG